MRVPIIIRTIAPSDPKGQFLRQ